MITYFAKVCPVTLTSYECRCNAPECVQIALQCVELPDATLMAYKLFQTLVQSGDSPLVGVDIYGDAVDVEEAA